jgi:NADP-dependent 3-hydroxy acid dehydrogenase YdfG
MSRWDVFCDQVICITGAASGFGKLMAEHLHAAGARLVISTPSRCRQLRLPLPMKPELLR